jgi:hypothetical protein
MAAASGVVSVGWGFVPASAEVVSVDLGGGAGIRSRRPPSANRP